MSCDTYPLSLEHVQEHATVVMGNMLSVLPVENWGGEEEKSAVWSAMMTTLKANCGASPQTTILCKKG